MSFPNKCGCGESAQYLSEDLLEYFCSYECFDEAIEYCGDETFRANLRIDNKGLVKIVGFVDAFKEDKKYMDHLQDQFLVGSIKKGG